MGRKVALLLHLGLGDMLAFRGLVAATCRAADQVALVCLRKYTPTLETLFEDLDVALIPVNDVKDISPTYGADGSRLRWLSDVAGYQVLTLGFHSGVEWRHLDPWWTRAMYKQAGLDPGLIVRGFRLPTGRRQQARAMADAALALAKGRKIVLIHDDATRRLTRPQMPEDQYLVLHVDDPAIRSDNLFDYEDVLRAADHLHAIDSCFALFNDLGGFDVPMTVHAYARDPAMVAVYERCTRVTVVRSALELI